MSIRRHKRSRRWLALTAISAIGIAVGFILYHALTIGSAWNSIERVALDNASTVQASDPEDTDPSRTPWLPEPVTTHPGPDREDAPATTTAAGNETTSPTTVSGRSQPLADAADPPSTLLLVGSDSRDDLSDLDGYGDFEGERADVIIVVIRRGDEIELLSVPRDLYVDDLCDGGRHRIGEAFDECGDRHRLAQLVAELEYLTGMELQHAVAVDLAGFREVVNRLGGYQICTDHALRDGESGLQLESGCTDADGETTLQWLRSRHTERLRNGEWEPVPGVSDLTRNQRQREFLADVLHRQMGRSGPGAVLQTARSVFPYLVIDNELTITDLAAWTWDLRRADIETTELPVTGTTTESGAEVLVPAVDIEEFISRHP